MLIRRARALFAVSLTFALLQLLAAASFGGAGAQSARSWMSQQQKSPAAEHGARTGVVESSDLHLPATPFAASSAFALDVQARASSPSVSLVPAIGTAAVSGQRHARAPPTLP